MASSSSSSFTLRSVLEKEKLNGTNFIDWIRNLRIVLKQERKDYVLENPIPPEPAANAPRAERDAYKKHSDDVVYATCLKLATELGASKAIREHDGIRHSRAIEKFVSSAGSCRKV